MRWVWGREHTRGLEGGDPCSPAHPWRKGWDSSSCQDGWVYFPCATPLSLPAQRGHKTSLLISGFLARGPALGRWDGLRCLRKELSVWSGGGEAGNREWPEQRRCWGRWFRNPGLHDR